MTGTVKIRCFECVAEIDPDSRFCDQCGAPVPEAAGGTASTRAHRRQQWVRSAAIAGGLGALSGVIGVLSKSKDEPPPAIAGAAEVVGRLSQRLDIDGGAPAIDVPASYVAPKGSELDVMSSLAPQWQQLQRVEVRVSPAGWKNGMAAVATGHSGDVSPGVTVTEIVEDLRQASLEQLAGAPAVPALVVTRGPDGHWIDLRATVTGRATLGAVTRFWATRDGHTHEAGCLCVGGPCEEMIETCALPSIDAAEAISIDAPIVEGVATP